MASFTLAPGLSFDQPNGTGSGQSITISPTGGDDTALINQAIRSAEVTYLGPGNFQVAGTVDIPCGSNVLGAGMLQTFLKLGAAGQVLVEANAGGADGGTISGFTIDGQSVQNVTGGGLHVAGGNKVLLQAVRVQNCAGDNCVIEVAQNWTIIDFHSEPAGRSSLVLDNGTGGHVFVGCEIAGACHYGLEIRQSKNSTGGYPTFLGPSGMSFIGCIFEYPGAATLAQYGQLFQQGSGVTAVAPGMIYHSAGTNNQFLGCSINLQNLGAPSSNLIVAPGGSSEHPAFGPFTVSAWNGTNQITLTGNLTGVTPLLSVGCSVIDPSVIVSAVSGQVVTLTGNPSSSPVGLGVSFGALSSQVVLDSPFFLGSQTYSTAIEQRGASTLYLDGYTNFQTHLNAYKQRASDKVVNQGHPAYANVTNIVPVQQSGDAATFSPDLQAATLFDGLLQTYTRGSGHRSFMGWRIGDTFPNVVISYPTGVSGTIAFSDGVSYPQNVQLRYVKDGGGAEHLQLAGTAVSFQASSLEAQGFAGASTTGRFVGVFSGAGHPAVGTWNTGDYGFDTSGRLFVCTAGGTPGTWAGADTAWATPTPGNGWSNLGSGFSTVGYRKDVAGWVHVKGVLAGGTATAGTALFTLPAGYRPAETRVFSVASSGAGEVRLANTGVLTIQTASASYLSLDNIHFMAEA